MTTAQKLDGQPFLDYQGPVNYEAVKAIYTFPDGSKAKAITTFIDCEPYLHMGVTVSKKAIKHWQAL